MANRPLLFFPRKIQVPKNPKPGGISRLSFPSPGRQRDRLAPQFRQLEVAFEKKRLALQTSLAGLLPEQVLVLETVGSVDDFVKALRGLHGLEWMGEQELEGIEPDEEFYDPKHPEAKLPGRLYLVWHDQEGMRQLLRLRKIFDTNPAHPSFALSRAKFASLFRQLKSIRPWSAEDRLETGLLENWQQAAVHGQETMRLEVELWSRRNSGERPRASAAAQRLIEQEGGRLLSAYDRADKFGYHALLIELPTDTVGVLLEEKSVALVQWDGVMFLRPTGQSAFPIGEDEVLEAWAPGTEVPLPLGEPVAALLDGLPLQGHTLLAGRLSLDDPDDWEADYPVSERRHGTAMASLILRGELDSDEPSLLRKLYVRPVLKPCSGWGGREERVPEDLLTVDLIERAVLRIARGDGTQEAAAPGVRIINLSLGDPSRPFDRFPSPWARLLDYLAMEFNLLFVVSAGNDPRSLELDLSLKEFRALAQAPMELRRAVLRSALDSTRHRRLLSPAESINALTVGGLNSDRSSVPVHLDELLDVMGRGDLPGLYNTHGPGFRRAVKPEILVPGGRCLLRHDGSTQRPIRLQGVAQGRVPGQRVASPGTRAGDLSHSRSERGTSNAAALATRLACQVYDNLLELQEGATDGHLRERDFPVLIKALLVHGASWGDRLSVLNESPDQPLRRDARVTRLLGFGAVDAGRVLGCTDQRVTLLGWGRIGAGSAYQFRFPLPPSLNGKAVLRRLVTTLAWMSPINPQHHRYRRAALWLDLYSGQREKGQPMEGEVLLGLKRREVEKDAARRGTAQHEVWTGKRATPYADDAVLTLQVNCRSEAGELHGLVPYALAVTLEVEEKTGLPIYEEVAERIRLQARIPVRPGG